MAILRKLGDMRLNKKGTIGTEPIGKMTSKGLRRGTNIKLGKLGGFNVMSRKKKVAKSPIDMLKAGMMGKTKY